MNKKLLFTIIAIATTSSYVKTKSKFDPQTCDQVDVHAVAFKNENCDPANWEEVCSKMHTLLAQVKNTEGSKGNISIFAFKSKKEDQDEDQNSIEEESELFTTNKEIFDIVSMNARIVKEKCSVQDWEKIYNNVIMIEQMLENTAGIKSGFHLRTSDQEKDNIS